MKEFSGAVKTIMCGTQRFTPARRQWMPVLYGMLTPQMVTAGSRKKVWWQCALGHVWKAAMYPPDRQAALRLPRLRRQNESREGIKINVCRKADFI